MEGAIREIESRRQEQPAHQKGKSDLPIYGGFGQRYLVSSVVFECDRAVWYDRLSQLIGFRMCEQDIATTYKLLLNLWDGEISPVAVRH
jgi:hypothetical protein